MLTLLPLLFWRSSGCWWAGTQWQWLCWGSEGSCCASPASRAPRLHSHLPCTNLQPQHMALPLLDTAFHHHNWVSFKDLNFVKPVAKLTVFCDALVPDKPAPAHMWSGSSWWWEFAPLYAFSSGAALLRERICLLCSPATSAAEFLPYREVWAACCNTHQPHGKQPGSNLWVVFRAQHSFGVASWLGNRLAKTCLASCYLFWELPNTPQGHPGSQSEVLDSFRGCTGHEGAWCQLPRFAAPGLWMEIPHA